jgi:hypothetical protein
MQVNTTPSLTVQYLEDRETKQAVWKQLADVKARDKRCEALYTPAELAQAEALEALARSVFIRSRVFLNKRDRFIALKIESVKGADRVSEGYDAFEKAMAELNAEKTPLNGHYIYHIFPRK